MPQSSFNSSPSFMFTCLLFTMLEDSSDGKSTVLSQYSYSNCGVYFVIEITVILQKIILKNRAVCQYKLLNLSFLECIFV